MKVLSRMLRLPLVMLAALGLLLAGGGSVTAAPGNNGTIKIEGADIQSGPPDNNPHQGCTFVVEFYNFDKNDSYHATVTFEASDALSGIESMCWRIACRNMSSPARATSVAAPARPLAFCSIAARNNSFINPSESSCAFTINIRGSALSNGLNGDASQPK